MSGLSKFRKCHCGKAVLARELCPTHYKKWRIRNVPSAREKEREHHRGRWRAGKRKNSPVAKKRSDLAKVVRMPDYYIRSTYSLPIESPASLLSACRTLLSIKRELRKVNS